ncbi:MAG: flavodoxin domain-containing protein [Bacteroidales bacterium]|nr:flavodoxin domain-containing protein [Bacteroidales bacterium]
MNKVAIFYGPEGGSTEKTAKKIGGLLGQENHELISMKNAVASDIDRFDNIIFGVATIGQETWDAEPVESGWFSFKTELEKADLKGKKIAIFGLGDHVRWPSQFVDSMGELYRILKEGGTDTIGKVSTADYTFDESAALVGDMFVGLPVDEDFEPELTDSRLEAWVARLKAEFAR